MFRLETFGGLVVLDEAGTEVATQPRRLALLALLAVAGARGMPRAKVQAFLWPESSAESARHGLEQLLYYLRRQLSPDVFLGSDPLRLNPTVISSDVAQFEQALATGALAEAVDLHRGPFLDGFYLTAAPEFERWTEEERGRLATAHREALFRLAEQEEAQGRTAAAIVWWRRLVMADQLGTRATLGLMRAMVAAGDRAGALRLARDHNALVQRELDAPPSPEISDLVARIREARAASPSAGNGGFSTHSTEGFRRSYHPADSPADDSGEPVGPPSPTALDATIRPATRRLLALGAAAGVLATVGTIATLGLRSRDAPALDPNLVAVAPFEVLDPRLELWREGLVDILSANLDGAGPLRAVPPTLVVRRWRGRVDRASAADFGRRTGARLALFGRLARIAGDSVRLRASVLDASRAEVLAELEVRGSEAGLDRLCDSLTVAVLRELGRTRRIGAARTASLGAKSLPALKAHLQGEQFYRRFASDSALEYFQRAVALDSTFAIAMSRAGQLLWSRDDSLARALALRAGSLNHGLGPRDSLLLAADSLLASIAFGAPDFDSIAAARGRRVLATLGAAARRYPDDPEIWYQLGDARFHLGWDSADSLRQTLVALDRAIELDSSFGLPYGHAVVIAGYLADSAGTRRRAIALLRHTRPGSELGEVSAEIAAGAELIGRLLDPAVEGSPAVDSLLRTTAPFSLWFAWHTSQRMADSAEIAVRLAREIASRPADADSVGPGMHARLFRQRHRLLAASLAHRGHLREAALALGSTDSDFFPGLFAELALQGGVPSDTARAVFDRWLRRTPFWPAGSLVFALPWWSARGDTVSLEAFRRRAVAAASGPVSASGQRNLDDSRYGAAAADAYLALARHDTTEALRRFAALSLRSCPWCFLERLTCARLLAARSRTREALEMLNPGFPVFYALPTRTVWELERARIAERAGDRATAMDGYHFVTQVWRRADPVLRPHVAEARAALPRLAGRPSR